jgi:hypothetical protein
LTLWSRVLSVKTQRYPEVSILKLEVRRHPAATS